MCAPSLKRAPDQIRYGCRNSRQNIAEFGRWRAIAPLYLSCYKIGVKSNTPLGIERILFYLELYSLKYLLSLLII